MNTDNPVNPRLFLILGILVVIVVVAAFLLTGNFLVLLMLGPVAVLYLTNFSKKDQP